MPGYTSPDNRLTYTFDTSALLEIEIRNDQWSKVDCNVFRSWTGQRRLNGEQYVGPRYNFLTNEELTSDDSVVPCEWFVKCGNMATTMRAHPVLGSVPICDRCDALVESMA